MERHHYRNLALYNALVLIFATGFGLMHRAHVSLIFENDVHFSILSELEREILFRSEMGLYYSYYKTVTDADNYVQGLLRVNHDNLSQYDNVINAVETYNLVPEIYTGFLYHAFKLFGLLPKPECTQVMRGIKLYPVITCKGVGVPIFFYLECIWSWAAATATMLFMYSLVLSDSILGGCITVWSFFYNHAESTRVQWSPPLRESFAYPTLLFQMYRMTRLLKEYQDIPVREIRSLRDFYHNIDLEVTVVMVMSLLSWQFSQFVYVTQLVAFLILKWAGIIPQNVFSTLLLPHNFALVFSWGFTRFTFCSLYMFLLISCNCCAFLAKTVRRHIYPVSGLYCEILAVVWIVVWLKKYVKGYGDDEHIYNLMYYKVGRGHRDFHTMLYVCHREFDFLPLTTYLSLTLTLLIPIVIITGLMACHYYYQTMWMEDFPQGLEPHITYTVLQAGAFVILAILFMRLKLFMTPHLCILAGLAARKKYLEKIGIRTEYSRFLLVMLILAGMSLQGLDNLRDERSPMGEFQDHQQEELLDWIIENTPQTAVFAGKMNVMANVKLSTQRPIVNNPYYESKEMRERTKKVYEVYSRKEVASVYLTLKQLKVDYVILEEHICYSRIHAKEGCQLVEMWDVEDRGRLKSIGKPPVCPILYHGDSGPFKRVFMNDHYAVLKLDDWEPNLNEPDPIMPMITLTSSL